ncbi:hypothetical protein [Chitinophaga rhizophila]|uniref:Uncharacterized protein n=1 Tax=Chitinophaga rhizophila TaxID=2866212 RepID=A0ABS7G7B5_9BACT|nr:hypothetical protein [Chitinophaga rhizophila]MBW8683553.1 hypothetical protein [Chitinophaga rhizophila]
MQTISNIWAFVKRRPKDFAFLIILLFFLCTTIIFGLRLNGQKVTLPFIDQYVRVVPEGTPNTVTATQLNKYSQIVGSYKYRCKSIPKNHGGLCRIEIISTDNGLQWKLTGERRWEEIKDSSGKVILLDKLDIPFQWETTWGDFISDNKIAYRYEITKTDRHIKGYAEGSVVNANYITGNYWQLPPDDPLYGFFEFKRQIDNTDVEW